jgi:hypothetical protein
MPLFGVHGVLNDAISIYLHPRQRLCGPMVRRFEGPDSGRCFSVARASRRRGSGRVCIGYRESAGKIEGQPSEASSANQSLPTISCTRCKNPSGVNGFDKQG